MIRIPLKIVFDVVKTLSGDKIKDKFQNFRPDFPEFKVKAYALK
jgi:hypothetical protein